jgi:phosphomannomutase
MSEEPKLTNKPLKKGKSILLFDIDGTLTAPRLPINDKMVECLTEVSKSGKVKLGSVGGSDVSKAKEQIGKVFHCLDYKFTENGLNSFDKEEKLFHSKKINQQFTEEQIKEFINYCLKYMSELDIPIKRGNFIEYRTGMINVSPIGRNCTQSEREDFAKYDKEHHILENFKKALDEKFAKSMDLKVSIGGQISFDCFPNGWDKRYCLQFLKDFDNIIFFGDKTYVGGNDFEISHSPDITRAYHVNSPDDTIKYIGEVLKELDEINK